jgi:hypothetical protein
MRAENNPFKVPADQQIKALLAGGITLLTNLGNALDDRVLTPAELALTLAATLAAYGAVFGITNGASPNPDTSTPQV